MTLEELNRALLVAPFHRWLNLRMIEADAEHILIEMPWRDEMISNPALPSMHGGILASLIDLTGFYAVLASGNMCKSTADLRVDYHRAASRQTLHAEGCLIKAGKSLSVADVRIHDEAGTLVASGRGAYNM